MHPAPTLDPDTVTLTPIVDPATAVSEAVRRTWPVTKNLHARVWTGVASTYEAWGVSWPVADLLGELAADYADDVLQIQPSPYVAVTAMIQDRRATVSVIPAQGAEPPRGAHVPALHGRLDSSWGQSPLASGPCLYAGINLISVSPRSAAR